MFVVHIMKALKVKYRCVRFSTKNYSCSQNDLSKEKKITVKHGKDPSNTLLELLEDYGVVFFYTEAQLKSSSFQLQ